MTRAGWVAVTAAAVLLALGYGLGYPELLALGAGALALLALGAVLVAGRPSVEVERQVEPHRVGRGDPAIALLDRPSLPDEGVNLQNLFYALQWWIFGSRQSGGNRRTLLVASVTPDFL